MGIWHKYMGMGMAIFTISAVLNFCAKVLTEAPVSTRLRKEHQPLLRCRVMVFIQNNRDSHVPFFHTNLQASHPCHQLPDI